MERDDLRLREAGEGDAEAMAVADRPAGVEEVLPLLFER